MTVSPFAGYDVASWLADLERRRAAHPFLVWAPFDAPPRRWTYAEFVADVRCIAGGLSARGIGPGDRVLVHLENGPETLLVRFACAWLGAVCVATSTLARQDELAFFAAASRARCAITQASLAALVVAACPQLAWIAVTGAAIAAPGVLAFDSLRGDPAPQRPADSAAEASVLFTTGSTARPKGVIWTHANILWAAQLNAQQQGLHADDVHLVFLPLFHVVGLSWALLSTMWAGGTVVLQPRFSRSRYWPAAIGHAATVGSHVNFTTAALMADAVPAHRFRQWITPRHDARQERRFGLTLVAGWGMTETLVQVIVSRPGCSSVDGSIGRPSLAYGVRIEDDHGGPVPAGGAGQLLVRGVPGLSLFKGYDGDDEATARAFDPNGFFATGDRVRLCADGSILFEDRLKDVIKVGGENVSALEVEQAIGRVPGVKEVAVVARPDPAYGETVVAFVVPADGTDTGLPAAVAGECARRLAKFKVPREVRLIDALPRVGVGKVAKAVLRDALRQDAAALPQVLALARSTVAEEPAP